MNRIITKNWLRLTLIFLISFSVTLVSARSVRLIFHHLTQESTEAEAASDDQVPEKTEEVTATDTEPQSFLDLQLIIDDWAKDLDSETQVSLMIYDLQYQKIAASYEADRIISTEGLQQLWFLNNDQPKQIISELEVSHTTAEGDYSTAEDITKLIEHYYELGQIGIINIEDDNSSNLLSDFTKANILAKKSELYMTEDNSWSHYHTAGVVEYSELGRKYVITIMTENLTDLSLITKLAQEIETTLLRATNLAS